MVDDMVVKPKPKKRLWIILGAVVLPVVIFAGALCLWFFLIVPMNAYKEAEALYHGGNLDEAIVAFEKLGNFSDSADRVKAIKYEKADKLYDEKEYAQVLELLEELGDYEDCDEWAEEVRYTLAERYFSLGQYSEAIPLYLKLEDYKDARDKYEKSILNASERLAAKGDLQGAIDMLDPLKEQASIESVVEMERMLEKYPAFQTIQGKWRMTMDGRSWTVYIVGSQCEVVFRHGDATVYDAAQDIGFYNSTTFHLGTLTYDKVDENTMIYYGSNGNGTLKRISDHTELPGHLSGVVIK